MSDLIERLKDAKRQCLDMEQETIADEDFADLFQDAITALSPVLPDEVAEMCKKLRVTWDMQGYTYPVQSDAADLMERQARETNEEYERAEYFKKKSEQLEANAAFFKCCALSGELPIVGSEPYPQRAERNKYEC